MGRRPLDVELVRRGLAETTEEARAAVRAGHVTVAGSPATKSTTLVAPEEPLSVSEPRPYVSRGGGKLAAALDAFAIDPAGRDCLDVGASTGGFTDRLLQGDARHVVALDVGAGLLAWELRTDPRVTVVERTNVRKLVPTMLPYRPSLIVADVSFISLRLVVAPLVEVSAAAADLVLLVKPQFEAARAEVGRGGVIRDPGVWRRAIEGIAESCRAAGAAPVGLAVSPVRGPAGNVEFLLHAVAGGDPRSLDVGGTVEAAAAMEAS
ncbi:MAG TPA: TlyA family RNA methyltransferase [Actinomycetota bacterium]|nr:TlyA family RNA methyltransferase [Actinomycetota bacterium]